MLPIVDKPLIQYAAEEAVAAGITELVFVTGRTKNAIIDHFDKAYELEAELASRGKGELLEQVASVLPAPVTCVFIRQAEALGLGHAVLCAKPVVGDEFFAVILADDLIRSEGPGCMAEMLAVHAEHAASVVAVERVAPADSDKYGIVGIEPISTRLGRINAIVEKPRPADAPSNLGVVGRYVLSPAIFELLERTPRGAGGEIQLTDGIAGMLGKAAVLAYQFGGKRYDCGSKLGYLQATVELALRHPELGDDFRQYLERGAWQNDAE
jgi:UTP--glucose-1-phosphate uridylyltransferase